MAVGTIGSSSLNSTLAQFEQSRPAAVAETQQTMTPSTQAEVAREGLTSADQLRSGWSDLAGIRADTQAVRQQALDGARAHMEAIQKLMMQLAATRALNPIPRP